MELSKFKLTLVHVKLPPDGHKVESEQTGRETVGGAALHDAPAALRETGQRDLAYVLHTSGTTGLPKIVKVPHKCILPNILQLR